MAYWFTWMTITQGARGLGFKSLKLIRWIKKSSASSLPWMICALFIYYCMMKKVWHSVDFFLNLESKYIKLIVYWLVCERSMVQITEAHKVNEKNCRLFLGWFVSSLSNTVRWRKSGTVWNYFEIGLKYLVSFTVIWL